VLEECVFCVACRAICQVWQQGGGSSSGAGHTLLRHHRCGKLQQQGTAVMHSSRLQQQDAAAAVEQGTHYCDITGATNGSSKGQRSCTAVGCGSRALQQGAHYRYGTATSAGVTNSSRVQPHVRYAVGFACVGTESPSCAATPSLQCLRWYVACLQPCASVRQLATMPTLSSVDGFTN
jgi:hypothetical protein